MLREIVDACLESRCREVGQDHDLSRATEPSQRVASAWNRIEGGGLVLKKSGNEICDGRVWYLPVRSLLAYVAMDAKGCEIEVQALLVEVSFQTFQELNKYLVCIANDQGTLWVERLLHYHAVDP